MLLILSAAPLETSLLRHHLESPQVVPGSSYQVFSGTLKEQPVLIAHGGIGQASMSLQLTRILFQFEVSAVLLCGCGGSYPASGLSIGDLALADSEIFGDLGTASEDGFIPLSKLQIPEEPDLAPICAQEIPLPGKLCNWAKSLLPQARTGPFVTVSCCSGTRQASDELARRTGGICENMEGAAAALVCREFERPLLEVRGISNPTGTRDPRQWDIGLGAEVAQQAVMQLLRHWPPKELTCS